MTATPLALKLCSDANVSFQQTFRYQYVVSPDPLDLPSFSETRIGGKHVYAGAALRTAVLKDGQDRTFGIILGIGIDHDGALAEEALKKRIPDATSPDAQDQLEHYLAILAGRYAVIVEFGGQVYFYCDPVGMIGAVYAAETGRMAASPALCIDRPYVPHPLYDPEKIEAGEGSYGFSHTCDMHVQRMNGSHRFHFSGFFSQRFWPRSDDTFTATAEDYPAIYDEIIAAEQNIIGRMVRIGKTAMPLTGGNDSRILFALTKPEDRPLLTQRFSHINNYANRRDSVVGTALCRAAGVPHDVHDRKKISVKPFIRKKASRSYQIASGTNGPVPKEIANGLFLSVTEGATVMRGHQCNILRGQYLTTSIPEKWTEPGWHIRIMRTVGENQFNTEIAKKFTPDFMRYYRDLPENAKQRSADFIFFETLVPAALGVLFPGQSHAFYLSPFNSRRLVQLCMQPDTAYRMTNAGTQDLILRAAPEIFPVPFNFELPADLRDDEESFEKRKSRCTAAVQRQAAWQKQPEEHPDLAPFKPGSEKVF